MAVDAVLLLPRAEELFTKVFKEEVVKEKGEEEGEEEDEENDVAVDTQRAREDKTSKLSLVNLGYPLEKCMSNNARTTDEIGVETGYFVQEAGIMK